MANEEHLQQLKNALSAKHISLWKKWRFENPDIYPDLTMADLTEADLSGGFFTKALMSGADLRKAKLCKARLWMVDLRGANLSGADLSNADLAEANLRGANLSEANLRGAKLCRARLWIADLRRADLRGADLSGADLSEADLSGANLSGADLVEAQLLKTKLENAILTHCRTTGLSAFGLQLEGARQTDLVLSKEDEPLLTTDDLDMAQLVYFLLHNPNIRNIVDIIGRNAVLILARFTRERKPVVEVLREGLRNLGYVPIFYDFTPSESQSLVEAVRTLALMSRFVIVDLSDPQCVPEEIRVITSTVRSVPIQPLVAKSRSSAAFENDLRHRWIQRLIRYNDGDDLAARLLKEIILPAEAKAEKLRAAAGKKRTSVKAKRAV